DAIVSHMDVGHQQAIVHDPGCAPIHRTLIEGTEFANDHIVSDLQKGVFVVVFQILGHTAHHSTRENMAILTNPHSGMDRHLVFNNRAFAYHHIVSNAAESAHCHTLGQDSSGMDVR